MYESERKKLLRKQREVSPFPEHTLILCRTVVTNPLYYGLSGYANHLLRQNYYYLRETAR